QDEPSTCTEAEPFALRVLDNSMEPEFRRGCVIIIDPTGRATDGSYVLVEGQRDVLFRQLSKVDDGWCLRALNQDYPPSHEVADDLSNVLGVIVQRAGVRRSYHKRYE
ncbi:MAG: S24 family peptidase, partial [Pseudomonadota bacterium]